MDEEVEIIEKESPVCDDADCYQSDKDNETLANVDWDRCDEFGY